MTAALLWLENSCVLLAVARVMAPGGGVSEVVSEASRGLTSLALQAELAEILPRLVR